MLVAEKLNPDLRIVVINLFNTPGLWTKPNCVVNGTSTTVKGLQEGKKYAFRIKAVNMYGTSEALESDTVTAKNPFGMSATANYLPVNGLSFSGKRNIDNTLQKRTKCKSFISEQ